MLILWGLGLRALKVTFVNLAFPSSTLLSNRIITQIDYQCLTLTIRLHFV